MATVNLGLIKFRWQGAYSGATAYVKDDVVSYNGSSYVCILASTGNLPTDTTYWNVMSQKGTDGTDITSIAGLAQGDILYYNGTDWVRLGAGTSGQVLQTGGAGANPSWGTVSSDFVKIHETNVTSTVSTVSLLDIFPSGYRSFKIVISDLLKSGTGDGQLLFKYIVSNSNISTNYYGSYDGSKYDNTNTSNYHAGGFWNNNYAVLSNWNLADAGNNQFRRPVIIDIDAPKANTNKHAIFQTAGMHESDTFYITHQGGFGCSNSTLYSANMTGSTDGVLFYLSTDGFDKGDFVVYGLK